MSDAMNPVSDQFRSLLSEFAQLSGLPDRSDADGLEFAAGEHTVCVVPHPERADLLLTEVLVGRPDLIIDPSADLLRTLHRINGAARFQHDWLITLSPDDALLIYTVRSVTHTTAADLESLLCEGIERAEALRALLAGLMGDGVDPEQTNSGELASGAPNAGSTGLPTGMIRA